MADEIKDLFSDETSADAAGVTPDAVPDATGDDGQQALELPAVEGEADPKPDATGAESEAGALDSAGTEDPIPAAPEAPGSFESLTPDAVASSDDAAASSGPAGAGELNFAPEAAAPNDGASTVDAPEADAPEADPATSSSPATGEDSAAEPATQAPAAPEKKDAPMPGLFDHGTPVVTPDTSIPTDQGYPVAQPEASPVHPQHFGQLQNDGVGDDAGKVVDGPKYPVPVDSVSVVAGGDEGADKDASSEEAPAPAPASEDGGVPSAIPPHVEGKLSQMFDRIKAIEEKIGKLLSELLD